MACEDWGDQMTRWVAEMRWTIVTTILVGVFVSSSATDYVLAMYRAWYDDTHPVVVMHGTLVSRDDGSATIHIKGAKLRSCRFVSLHAYTDVGGEVIDAYKARVNRVEDGSTKPVGQHDLGFWRVWPTEGAEKVMMSVLHDCNGRLITAVIAEVKL